MKKRGAKDPKQTKNTKHQGIKPSTKAPNQAPRHRATGSKRETPFGEHKEEADQETEMDIIKSIKEVQEVKSTDERKCAEEELRMLWVCRMVQLIKEANLPLSICARKAS